MYEARGYRGLDQSHRQQSASMRSQEQKRDAPSSKGGTKRLRLLGEQVFVLRLLASIRRKARRKPIATTHLDLAGRLRGKELHRVRCDKLRRACPKRDGPRSTTRAAQRTAAASQCGNKGVGVENNCRTWEAGDSIHLAGQQ